jgi:hypothetical protein
VQGCARTSGGAGTSEPAASWSAYNKRYGWVPAVGTCTPNPDYWGGLLWHRLMGSKGQRVMNMSAAFATGADVTLRAYGHCGNTSASGDLSLVLINLLNASNTVNLPGAVGARTDYVLTPGEPAGGWEVDHHGQRDETKTDVVLLNGEVLSLDGAALPAISGAAGSGGSVALPPLAIAFVVVHKSASCASLKTDESQGHVRYCPSADDLVVAYSAPLTPSLKDRGWTLHGGGGVATKSSFNLLGGFAEFDLDFSAVNEGVNANIYSISPRLHGGDFSKAADYCDGGGNTSKPAGKGGYCLEVDWIESNGKCGGATAIHDVPGRNTSRRPLGCNAAGCRKEYLYMKSTMHMRAEYDTAGRLTLTHENQTITPKQWVPLPNASDWSVTERSYASLGAVIYSSQWIGWAPAQALGCIDPHSCNFPTPGNCSAVLASSTYTVSNLEVFGTVVQGPVPTVCKVDDAHALRSSFPLQCTAANDFPQQTTFHAFNPDAVGHTAHLNDANAIFEYRGIFHIMAQHGGGNWSHQVSNDLVRWWSLPDALDGNASSSWDQDTCDGVVSFPDLGRAPYNGSTPVMLYGPDCGKKLPPTPPPGGNVGSGDYPSVAVALPAHDGTDVHLTKWEASSNPVSFDGVPCSFPGRVWKSVVGARWNMLCALDGRGPWSLFSTTDATLLTGWKLADKAFATDASGAVPSGGGAGALFHRIPDGGGDLYTFNTGTGDRFAVGRYDAKAEKLALLSDAHGKAKQYVLDHGIGYSGAGIGGVYKWATTGRSADGRLLTTAWVDEGECAPDSPRTLRPTNPRNCNGMRHRSVFSLPREIRWDAAAAQLVSRPVAELASLRNASYIADGRFVVQRDSRRGLAQIPRAAGGALDLEFSFALPLGGRQPRDFGVAVRAERDSLAGAAVQLMFNVSAPFANGSRSVSAWDVARPAHLPAPPVMLARWNNDTDIHDMSSRTCHHAAADYDLTRHPPGSGDTAATCQATCDADKRCAAWVWVVRGLPAGTADCIKKALPFGRCPAQPRPHPCKPCTLTSGAKTPSGCDRPRPPAVAFGVELLKGETSLAVRILVDRPVVEVFVQGGRAAFVAASNFSVGRASVHLVNDGAVAVAATVNASGMGCGWANALPLPTSTSAEIAMKTDDSGGRLRLSRGVG